MGPGALAPTPERFRALARSSPWRWRTLRFTLDRPGGPTANWEAVRGWIRRPGLVRVERLDGTLLRAERREPSAPMPLVAYDPLSEDPVPQRPRPPHELEPGYDADGLVRERARGAAYDDPMHGTYHWVAMLDPVEVADGSGPYGESLPAVAIDRLAEVYHHGRRAWEAVVRPIPAYDPRCSCCPLLPSEASDAREADAGGPLIRDSYPDYVYPDTHRVRLDVGTGVCVLTEAIGGSAAGAGHEVVIEAVDEAMDDDLFARPRRWRRRRR